MYTRADAHCMEQYADRHSLLNTNVDGKRKIMYALTEIKGVGRRYSNIVCKKADVDLNKRYVECKRPHACMRAQRKNARQQLFAHRTTGGGVFVSLPKLIMLYDACTVHTVAAPHHDSLSSDPQELLPVFLYSFHTLLASFTPRT